MATALATRPGDRVPARRSQAQRRSDAEKKLLHAAVQIVAVQGLERFTLAEVGEAAGYSRGLPGHYFGSKEGLVAALAEHIVGGFGVGLGRVEKHPAGLDRLLGMVAFYFDSAARDPQTARVLFAVMSTALTDPVLKGRIATLNASSARAIGKNITAGMASGTINVSVDPAAQASLILSGMRGAVIQWMIDPAAADLKSLKTEFLASLHRSLTP